MGYGFVVSVLSLVKLRIPSEYLHRLTCRFFLNLRAIAFYQRKSIFENRVPSFDTSPFGIRPLRDQSGRLLTNKFIHVEMEKTVYTTGTIPIEGNTEHPDIIDLEEIDSPAHQQRE